MISPPSPLLAAEVVVALKEAEEEGGPWEEVPLLWESCEEQAPD